LSHNRPKKSSAFAKKEGKGEGKEERGEGGDEKGGGERMADGREDFDKVPPLTRCDAA
jgi:hypothetical protein